MRRRMYDYDVPPDEIDEEEEEAIEDMKEFYADQRFEEARLRMLEDLNMMP